MSDVDTFDIPSNSYVADIAWIRRGVAKYIPDKVELASEDLKELLRGGNVKETSDDSSDENDDKPDTSKKTKLRGSASDLASDLNNFNLENYDKEDDAAKGPSFKGLAYYASQLDDPYITKHQDSEDEEERDDFELKPSDNLVVIAKSAKDEFCIDVYVYNEDNDDWYLHHDYILEAPPLCLTPFQYDPGNSNGKGNLLAVGTMEPTISVWDLDVVNTLEPVLCLGEKSKKTKKQKGEKTRKKRDGSVQGHSDAVLSLDWNSHLEHILASGGADSTIVLWDLDEAKAAQCLNEMNGMVQSLQWHPIEDSILLAGTRSGTVSVLNCKASPDEGRTLNWSVGNEVEVENVLWNRFQPYYAFVCSNDGKLRYFDTRKPGEFITEILAHEGGVNSVSQSFYVRGLVATAGNKEIKVWKLENNSKFRPIYQQRMNMGSVQVTRFSPDSGCVLAVGANAQDNARILDFSTMDTVVEAFNESVSTDDSAKIVRKQIDSVAPDNGEAVMDDRNEREEEDDSDEGMDT